MQSGSSCDDGDGLANIGNLIVTDWSLDCQAKSLLNHNFRLRLAILSFFGRGLSLATARAQTLHAPTTYNLKNEVVR